MESAKTGAYTHSVKHGSDPTSFFVNLSLENDANSSRFDAKVMKECLLEADL